MAIQDAEGQRLLSDLDPEARLASWHLVAPDGRRSSAGPALVEVLELLPGGAPPGRLLARLDRVADRLYGVVVRNRGRVGRRLPRASVRRASARIAQRSAPDSLIHREAMGSEGIPAAGNC